MPPLPEGTRIGAPVAGSRQFIAIGLNYRKHAAEAGMPIPKDPVVFNKALTCIQGPNDDVVQPAGSETLDWEVELAFYIGTKAQRVSKENAVKHVAGYSLANDVSERNWQANRSGQWVKGKSFDTFGPLGPWLVTTDEIPDPQNIPISLSVNGTIRQESNTSDMIFTVAEIIAHLSAFMTLLPGDIVATGTPEGVGAGMKPPLFLKRGDVVELKGGILGEQRQRVV
jgi:2-keto-4-pentenoate hydratase/2-oxohepta-3-ene-1,7-dioic acid hydratase in catechol pathway